MKTCRAALAPYTGVILHMVGPSPIPQGYRTTRALCKSGNVSMGVHASPRSSSAQVTEALEGTLRAGSVELGPKPKPYTLNPKPKPKEAPAQTLNFEFNPQTLTSTSSTHDASRRAESQNRDLPDSRQDYWTRGHGNAETDGGAG